jgi:hypothetical protein
MSAIEPTTRALDAPEPSLEALRVQLDASREREREIAELLGSSSTNQIVHDLRNLLNEVELLRAITADAKGDA